LRQLIRLLSAVMMITPLGLPVPAMAIGGPRVQRLCIEPANEALQECLIRRENENASLVGLDALRRQQEAGDSMEDSTAALADTQRIASAAHGANSEVCADLATKCEEDCSNAWNFHNERAMDPNNRQRPQHQQWRTEAQNTIQNQCMDLANGAVAAAGRSAASAAESVASDRTSEALDSDGSGDGATGMGGLGDMALGAGLLAGAMCMFGSLCEDEEE